MKPIPVDLKLHLGARSELSLRSGDSVALRVIKRLTVNKWAVAIRGRVLPAFSKVDLSPGQVLRALVEIRQGRITLKISGQSSEPIQDLLARQGLRPSQQLENIAAALLRSGLAVSPERLQQLRQMLERLKLDSKKFARMLAIALDKGIDLRSRGLAGLVALLGYGEQEAEEGEGRRRRMPADPEELMRLLQGDFEQPESGEGSGLQVFNHLPGSEHTWIVIPFSYTYAASGVISGTVRLRYDVRNKQADRLVVAARSATGGKWSFVLKNCQAASGAEASGPGASELFVFSDPTDRSRKVRAELDVLRIKLQNLGVKIDDTIREDQNFDGFDLPWEELSYQNVDTVR